MTDSRTFDREGVVKGALEVGLDRRTGSEESRLPRQQQSETHGSGQPILVGKRNPEGQAPLIFGNPVDATPRSDGLDTFDHLPPWIIKKRHREAIPAIDLAHAIARLVDLHKQLGQNKSFVADALHMSNARFSKYLALAKAPEEIQALSAQGELQDVELLYQLKKAYETKPAAVGKLIEKWRNKELTTSLSRALSQLTDKPQSGPTAPASKSSQSEDGEQDLNQNHQPGTADPVQRASAFTIQAAGADTHLIVEVGKKKFWFSLPPDAIPHLKDLVRKL